MKMKDSKLSRAVRSGISLIIVAAVVIEVMGAVQYLFARNSIKEAVEQVAATEVEARGLEITNMATTVEVGIANRIPMIEAALFEEEDLYQALRQVLQRNPIIEGCAVGFRPEYATCAQGGWYEPFAGRVGDSLIHGQIGGRQHDYLNMEWYVAGQDSGRWTEPYFDDAGSRKLVCSYTMPVRDRMGEVVGVFCCDVSLDWLVKQYSLAVSANTRRAVGILVSRQGRIIASPDSALVMQTTLAEAAATFSDTNVVALSRAMMAREHGSIRVSDNDGEASLAYYAPVGASTGWTLALVYPEREMYAGLHRVGSCLFILMILGLLLMAYILWRTVRSHRRLATVSAEKERIANDLRIASGIQRGMLPKTFPPYPDLDEVSLFGILEPAKEVGGDLYDFYVRNDRLYFCIGDVSGKGVPASLVMAVTRSLFRTLSAHNDAPERIVGLMNAAMSEMNESSMFVTLFVGVLDLASGRLAYCNAGHCPPVVVGGANPRTLKVEANIPVSLVPDWNYCGQQAVIEPGQTLLLYTDGLTEAEDINHALFGEARMMEVLQHADPAPKVLVEQMVHAVHTYVGTAEKSDDLTLLAVQLTATKGSPSKTEVLTLQNDISQVPLLAEFVEGIASAHHLDATTTMNINLALEEAVVNVMNYAYREGTTGEILVGATAEPGQLRFTIADSGVPFDPTQAREPDLDSNAEERPIGGLGIHLVRQLVDAVQYRRTDGQNILTLTKKI